MGLRKQFDKLMNARLPDLSGAHLPAENVRKICRQHGRFSLAHSTAWQTGLSHFGNRDGYIAYKQKSGFTFVLGDPVCAENEREALITEFVGQAKRPSFLQVSADTARILGKLGYPVNAIGFETSLPLNKGKELFAGKRNETVRYSERWLLKNGFRFVEDTGGEIHDAIEDLSNRWRATRNIKKREMAFLNRPFKSHLDNGMRRLVLKDPEGAIAAFIDFDPLWDNGEITGYSTAFKRKMPGTTAHTEIGLTKHAADMFITEGFSTLSLGFSPLAESSTDAGEFRGKPVWLAAQKRAYQSPWVNRKYFNLQGQAAFKRRFHGIETPCYMAIGSGGITEAIAQLRLIKLI